MLSIDDKIINIFFKIDEKLKKFEHKSHYHSKFSDSEVISLMITKIFLTLKSDKIFHKLIKEKFSYLFPKLPEYSRYLKRVKNLSFIVFKLIEEFSFETIKDLFIIDTKPIPIIEIQRVNRSILVKIFRQWRINPNYGYCSARKLKYFGFKLICLWNNDKIFCYTLVSANASEQECLM